MVGNLAPSNIEGWIDCRCHYMLFRPPFRSLYLAGDKVSPWVTLWPEWPLKPMIHLIPCIFCSVRSDKFPLDPIDYLVKNNTWERNKKKVKLDHVLPGFISWTRKQIRHGAPIFMRKRETSSSRDRSESDCLQQMGVSRIPGKYLNRKQPWLIGIFRCCQQVIGFSGCESQKAGWDLP